MGNVLCKILDRDAGLDTADVGLREHQPIEGDVARWGQLDLLNGLCHVSFSENRRPRASLSASNPFTNSGRPPLPLWRARNWTCGGSASAAPPWQPFQRAT